MLLKQLRKFLVFMAKVYCQVPNWFSKFHSCDVSPRNEPKPGHLSGFDQDALRELVERNPCKRWWEAQGTNC